MNDQLKEQPLKENERLWFEVKVGEMEKMGFVQVGVVFDLITQKEDNTSASVAASAIEENIFHVKPNYSYLPWDFFL